MPQRAQWMLRRKAVRFSGPGWGRLKKPSDGYEAADAGGYTVDFESGSTQCDYCYGVSLSQGAAGTLVLRELPSETKQSAIASFLASDARPVATNARVRFLNAASGNREALDAYLIEQACEGNGSLAEKGLYELVVAQPEGSGNPPDLKVVGGVR